MTTKTDITRQIEETLGSDGSPQMAAQMFESLDAVGAIGFHPALGYHFIGEDRESGEFPAWDAALDYVSGASEVRKGGDAIE